MKRIIFGLFVILLSYIPAVCAPVIYQAENGTQSGTVIGTSRGGYQGTGYVTGFNNAGEYCEVTVNVPSAGMYTITLGYAADSQKINDLYANGVFQASVTFPISAAWSSVTAGMVPLNSGNNTLRIVHNWGWFDLDWFGVEAAVLPALSVSKTLVNANATQGAKCLMSYLVDSYGNSVISGQCGSANAEWINTNTGKYPAMQGFDMMDYSPSRVAYGVSDPLEVERAIAWYQAGGIVQFQWHWNAPSGLINTFDHEWWRGFYTHATTFDLEYAMNNTASQQYIDIIRDIDAIAVQLKRLRDAGVPVLWRPLHEAQGGWFWWGAKGYAPCVALYHLVYDRLTNYHGLNNLIWVWTTQDNAAAANWSPGNTYVDIVGADIYLAGLNYSPSTSMFYNIVNLFGGNKMVAMTETGTIPDPALMTAQHAHWAYFLTWNGFENDPAQNSLSHVQSVYGDAYVITRDELVNVYLCTTPSPTNTRTNTVTPAQSQTFTATRTWTVTASPAYTFTLTDTVTFTPVNTATNTPVNTATNTPVNTATNTPVNTATNTPVNTATNTPVNTATNTPVNTETNTPVNTETNTPVGTETDTPVITETNTPVNTETSTPVGTGTDTPVITETNTPVNTATSTPVITETNTLVLSETNTPVNTASNTPVNTLTATPVNTAVNTLTITPTFTVTLMVVSTPAETATGTAVVIATVTLTPVIPESGVYPNPYVTGGGNFNVVYELNEAVPGASFLVYTKGFRLIKRVDLGACQAGRGVKIIDSSWIEKLSTGGYLYVVEARDSGGKTTRSKIGTFMILRRN